jgi:hypothetical protein
MSWKSYTTHLLLVVAILVVGPSVGIVVALTCNEQKANNPVSRCRYTDLSPCEGRDHAHCTGDGQYPQNGNWGDCSSGFPTQYCGYPQNPFGCYLEWTCNWDEEHGTCVVKDLVAIGWWTWPQNYPCDPVG